MLSDEIYDVSNDEIIKNNYLKIKKEWDENSENIKDIEFDINELLLDDTINKYLELLNNKKVVSYLTKCKELNDLKKDKEHIYTKLSFLHQKMCEHPAYFIVEERYVKNSDEKFYTCSCIECGKGLTRRVDQFEDVVLIHPKNIKNAEEEYKEYKKEYKRLIKRIS